MKAQNSHRLKQCGASLIIGLVLLMVLSVLAVSTMSTGSLELTMAGNAQFAENAFQMAESGIDQSMAAFNPSALAPVPQTTVVDAVTNQQIGTYQATTAPIANPTAVPPSSKAFSLPSTGGGPGGGYLAYHFQIVATGASARGAQEQHTQELFKVSPN